MKSKIDQLAILQVQAANFHKLCSQVESESLWGKFKTFQEEVDQFEKTNLPELMYHVNLIGHDSSNISHYDIDEVLVKEFGDSVRADSESGMFSVYIRKESVEDVKKFLNENFKSLSYKEYKDMPISYFNNWTQAKRYVDENNLIVPEIPIDKEKLVELERLKSNKEGLKKQIEEIDEKIANLF